MTAFKYFYVFALTVLIIIYCLIPSEKEGVNGTEEANTVTESGVPVNPPPESVDSKKDYFLNVLGIYEEANELIDKREFQLASMKHQQAEEIYRKASFYDLTLDGRKAADIYKEVRENFLLNAKSRKDDLFEAYKNLDLNNDAISRMSSIRYDLFKEVSDEFYQKRSGFHRERQAKAPKVLMLKFSGYEKYFNCELYEYLKRNWPENSPVQLAMGPAETTQERELVWKHMEIQLTVLEKDYNQIVQNYGGRQTSYTTSGYKLPIAVRIRFLPISSKAPTNWEEVMNFSVKADSPNRIKLDNNDTNQMARLTLMLQKELSEKLKKELEKLPKLEIYPGVDLTGNVFTGDKIDKDLLNALRLKNSAKFKETLGVIKEKGTDSQRAELCFFIAENQIAEEAEWLADEMYNQSDIVINKTFELMRSLESFGNYEVALAMAASVEDHKMINRFLVHMKKYNDETEQRLFKLITENKKVKSENRKWLVSILLNSLMYSRDRVIDIKQYAILAEDKNIDIAVQFLKACMKLDQELHSKVFDKVYAAADEKQRRTLILDLKFEAPYKAESLEMLKRLVKNETSGDLLKRIIYKLTSIAKTPEGWEFLNELTSYENIKSNKDHIYSLEKALVYSSADALGEKAIPFLEKMISEEKHLGYAASELLDIQGNNGFQTLVDKLPKLSFKSQIYIYSYMDRAATRNNSNYGAPSFYSFISWAQNNEKPDIRKYAYTLMGTCTKRKWKDYTLDLKKSLEKETDDRAKNTINSVISGL